MALPAADHAFAFMLGGALAAGGAGARFTVFAGTPLPQPRLMQGPFVASQPQQLMRFAADHAAGRFGRLQPFGRV